MVLRSMTSFGGAADRRRLKSADKFIWDANAAPAEDGAAILVPVAVVLISWNDISFLAVSITLVNFLMGGREGGVAVADDFVVDGFYDCCSPLVYLPLVGSLGFFPPRRRHVAVELQVAYSTRKLHSARSRADSQTADSLTNTLLDDSPRLGNVEKSMRPTK